MVYTMASVNEVCQFSDRFKSFRDQFECFVIKLGFLIQITGWWWWWWWWMTFYGPFLCTRYAKWAKRPPRVMKRSQRWNNLHICPRGDSNTGGSGQCSNTLPLDHAGRRHHFKTCLLSYAHIGVFLLFLSICLVLILCLKIELIAVNYNTRVPYTGPIRSGNRHGLDLMKRPPLTPPRLFRSASFLWSMCQPISLIFD